MTTPAPLPLPRNNRTAISWMALSIATALTTMALKTIAAALSGSVGILSDALESGVNLVAACVTLVALHWSAKPPDETHPFGHAKGEGLATLFEGLLVLLAGIAIIATSVDRLLHPADLQRTLSSTILTGAATALNGIVGALLVRAGKKLRSHAVEADGQHLLTDVWTSIGVIIGMSLAAKTGLGWIDPLCAALVAVMVLWTAVRILQRAMPTLLDSTLGPSEAAAVDLALEPFRKRGVVFAEIRSRTAGRHVFVHIKLQVPAETTVLDAHNLADEIERAVEGQLDIATVETHVEPLPASAPQKVTA